MESVSELETELQIAQKQLNIEKSFTSSQGMIPYYKQFFRVNRLKDELNLALKTDG